MKEKPLKSKEINGTINDLTKKINVFLQFGKILGKRWMDIHYKKVDQNIISVEFSSEFSIPEYTITVGIYNTYPKKKFEAVITAFKKVGYKIVNRPCLYTKESCYVFYLEQCNN